MIRTVTGDIEAADLGVTLSHEHLLMTGGWPIRNEPDFRLDSVDAGVAEMELLKAAGGRAVVEMTPLGFGRDPDGLVAISERTGMHIVACTGFHKMGYYAANHWLTSYPVETIAVLLIAEVDEGIDRGGLDGPVVSRSSARAGVIKIATEYHKPDARVARLIEAVAMAHAATGVPISTHTEKGTAAHWQLDRFEEHGVPLTSVTLGHIDHNPDAGFLGELASRGAWLCFDMPGRIKYGPDSQTLTLIEQLADDGHADHLLLGSDLARRSYWTSLGGGPGLDYLLTTFVPRLEAMGLGEVAQKALVTNAAKALTFATGSA